MVLLVAVAIGVLTGLRTFAPLAVWRLGFRDWTSVAAGIIAIGEIVADKFPNVPSRTAVGPLVGRCVVGGFVASTASYALGVPYALGAIAGITGALIGAYGGYAWRVRIAPRLQLPDIAAALIEDAIAVAGAFLLFR